MAFGSLGFFAEYNSESYNDSKNTTWSHCSDMNPSSCLHLANVQMIHHFPRISGTFFCKFISKDAGAEFAVWKFELSCAELQRFLQGGRLPVLEAKFVEWDTMRYEPT